MSGSVRWGCPPVLRAHRAAPALRPIVFGTVGETSGGSSSWLPCSQPPARGAQASTTGSNTARPSGGAGVSSGQLSGGISTHLIPCPVLASCRATDPPPGRAPAAVVVRAPPLGIPLGSSPSPDRGASAAPESSGPSGGPIVVAAGPGAAPMAAILVLAASAGRVSSGSSPGDPGAASEVRSSGGNPPRSWLGPWSPPPSGGSSLVRVGLVVAAQPSPVRSSERAPID